MKTINAHDDEVLRILFTMRDISENGIVEVKAVLLPAKFAAFAVMRGWIKTNDEECSLSLTRSGHRECDLYGKRRGLK